MSNWPTDFDRVHREAAGDDLTEITRLRASLAYAEARADHLEAKYQRASLLIGDMQDEFVRLRTIVNKLPKTADGVPLVPGMLAYHPNELDDPHLVTGVYNFQAAALASECSSPSDPDWCEFEVGFRGAIDDCSSECDPGRPAGHYYSTREAAEAARQPAPKGDSDE